ncbi:N-acetylglucosamine-6-phosphate deacetylase [Sphingomonas hengshuiensis]|uniref:N-acetylglucosamine 6-phosphate deacetylase n=1 Tax=Sphingomonas hengshuiensis TaxID=1609977 RepID=A0A7U4J8Y1_9SPHN|nr:N-acetylglucosamine-6-phosphate deacetylase [Sphingomonas hengshuiensis]AJP72437.1 N-acetylglucosamine 6-phosphate deacetylase [Sphingomonas hengshuiensis]
MTRTALTGAAIVAEGRELHGHALLLDGAWIAAIVPEAAIPADAGRVALGGGWLLPGFIDTQVNGGGDVLFNDAPTVEGIRAIAAAHRRFGTTGILPTLISDDLSVVEAAIDAVDAAIQGGVPGVLGIHVEGPFLNQAKRGIHDATKFRTIDDSVIALLTRPGPGVRLVTLAPELAPPGAIRALVAGGVIVAAGHSMADYAQTRAAFDEGLHGFTHLFNAMTQLGSREPGMVGAAIEDRASHFGLIVDGHHVHPAALKIAIAARGIDGAMLVTDAMPPVGGTRGAFTLMGTEVKLEDGTLRGPDGTLAGSALTMAAAVRNAMDLLGHTLAEASAMASANPAAFLRLGERTGAIAPGLAADLVHVDAARRVTRTWIGGVVSVVGE